MKDAQNIHPAIFTPSPSNLLCLCLPTGLFGHRQTDSWWCLAFGATPNASLPSVVRSSRSPSSSASSSSASAFSCLLAFSCFPSVLLFARLLWFPLPPSFSSRPLPSFPRSRCAPYYAAFRTLFAVGRLVRPAAAAATWVSDS